MRLAKATLLFGAIVFAGIGIGFLILPVQWAALVDIQLPTAMARTDVRATYGGFDLAVGAFLGSCALRVEWVRPGLAALAMAAVGFGGGRLLGLVVEGTASPLMLTLVILEIATAFLAFYLYRRLPRQGS
jgi:Domain of unknown function (DUF4345)